MTKSSVDEVADCGRVQLTKITRELRTRVDTDAGTALVVVVLLWSPSDRASSFLLRYFSTIVFGSYDLLIGQVLYGF